MIRRLVCILVSIGWLGGALSLFAQEVTVPSTEATEHSAQDGNLNKEKAFERFKQRHPNLSQEELQARRNHREEEWRAFKANHPNATPEELRQGFRQHVKEHKADKRGDMRDRRHPQHDHGVRDHSQGVGAGKGQGKAHRSPRSQGGAKRGQ